jgi:Tol biopolymer transport system component
LTLIANVPPGAGVFSPNLTRIAFYENLHGEEGEPSLSVINIDGAVTRLTELPRLDPQMPAFPGDLTPVWSPDESKLAFTTCGENIVGVGTLFCRLYVVNADGSGLVLLGDGEFPAWSPDGSHLAFTEMGTFLADTGEGNRDMYIIEVDGSGLTRLTENLGTFTRYPSWFQSSNE